MRLPIACAFLAAARGSDGPQSPGNVTVASLPLAGDAKGPVIASITIFCGSDKKVGLIEARATDADGPSDIDKSYPLVRVYCQAEAGGASDEVKLYFDTVDLFEAGDYYPLLLTITAPCGSNRWPVEAVFPDETGHVTSGNVWANVQN